MSSYPPAGTPEGDRWAAAGFPADPAGNPQVPPAPAPAPAAQALDGVPAVGDLVGYPCHDAYASPARDRVQVITVTGHEDDGAGGVRIRGLALGFTEDTASFTADQLTALG